MKIPFLERYVSAEVERRLREIERDRRLENHMRDIEEITREYRRDTDVRFSRYEKDIKTYVDVQSEKLENQFKMLSNAIMNVASACSAREQVKWFFEGDGKDNANE